MKVNFFLSIIGLLLASLVSYLVYSIAKGLDNDVLGGVFSGICFIATIIPAMGLQYSDGRLGVNIRILSVTFFFFFLIINICFATWGIVMPYYVIVNGMALLVFLALIHAIHRA